jgi:TatD DNase family protein
MILTDTHAHLYSSQFNADRDAMIQRAIDANVSRLFLPNIDLDSIEGMLELSKKYPENCFAMMGLHPCDVKPESYESILEKMEHWLSIEKFCAVGEIGIDLYWDKTTLDIQLSAFKTQCNWASERNLPVVIHTRESMDLCIQTIKKMKLDNLRGVFHCFTGSVEQAKEITKLGFMLGIGGVVTYKNTNLRETLTHIDLQHILLETDAPYLSPVPHRGKRNESANIQIVAQTLSEVYNCTVKQIADITTSNSKTLFGV